METGKNRPVYRGLKEITKDKSQGYRVYDPKGIATNQASQAGGLGAKTGLYIMRGRPKYENGKRKLKWFQYDECPTVGTNVAQGDQKNIVVMPVLTPGRLVKRQNGRRMKTDGEPSFTLNTQDKHGIFNGPRIRRLTPTECERLMSWPEDWTKWGINEKGEKVEMSDTQRYKMCGNGVVSKVVEEVVRQFFSPI